jgi:hypothetical protein
MGYVSETKLKEVLCDASSKIKLCKAITVNGIALTANSTFKDLVTALNGLSGGGGGSFTALSSDVVSTPTGGVTIIQPNVVTNAKLAQVPTKTIKGKTTAGTGNASDLTVSEVQAMINTKALSIVTTTGTTVMNAFEVVTTSGVTRTLPSANTFQGLGEIIIKNTSGGNINITPNGAELLDSANTTLVLPTNTALILRASTASAWETVANFNTSGGTTTNTLTSASSVIVSTVNGIIATLTPVAGTIAQQLGFDSTGAFVKQTPSVGSGNLTGSSGNSSFEYIALTGTPVITCAKASGTNTMTVTGGTIKLLRFDDLVIDSERDGANDFKWVLVGTGLNTQLAIPNGISKRTMNATDALADASSNGTISNQFDIDNTPNVKYGNIVLTGQGGITIRSNNVPTSSGAGNSYSFKW